MLRPWKIGTIFGVQTGVHWSLIILPIYFLVTNFKFGWVAAGYAVLVSFAFLLFVLMHEFGHVLAARMFGIPTASVTLYPIGGVALMKRQAHNPFEEIVIALAGPAVNLLLAIILGVISFAAQFPFEVTDLGGIRTFSVFFHFLIVVNIVLLAFNMLPAFPMDGGRVLRAFFWFFLDIITATRLATYVAIPFAILIALLGVYQTNPLTIVIAGLIVFLGRLELYALRMRQEAERRRAEQEAMESAMEPVEVEDWQPRPAPEADFDGYTWDARAKGWVEWRSGRPIRIYPMQLW